jgi:hypothetical protein
MWKTLVMLAGIRADLRSVFPREGPLEFLNDQRCSFLRNRVAGREVEQQENQLKNDLQWPLPSTQNRIAKVGALYIATKVVST